MKVKNRRAAAKVGSEQQAGNNGEYTERQMIETSHGGKRKRNVETTRPAKPSKHSTSSHLANGTIDSGSARRKRNVNPASNSCSTVFKPGSSNLSNSCSSSSSTASCPAETVDPYEFAVKTEEEQGECSSTCVVPPMKRIKLDRVEERCFPDSAQSSPLPQPAFSHPSPDANSSPLVAHCTRPLSVLTDFSSSSSSINRSNSDADGGGHRNSGPCNPGLETALSRQPSGHGTTDCLVSVPSAGMTKTKNSSSHGAETPSTVPAIDSAAGCRSRSPGFTLTSYAPEKPHAHTDLSAPCPTALSPVGHSSCSNACSTPTLKQQRCVGVNTMLDTCKATLTEPDLLGPCEPGTTICLNGIVWLETTTGVLVVNVTWRGRTYIGTLLDATQHDFAPPCPRDYVPPFKSSVRSSNRNKRRNAVAMNYKQHSSLNGSAIHTPDSSSKNSSVANTTTPRNRLRGGRTARSPSLSTNAATESNGPGGKGTAIRQSVVDGDDKPSTTGKANNEIKSGPDVEEEEEHRLPPLSDEEMILDPSSRRPSEKVGTKIKRGSSTSSSDCPSENLHDPVERLTDEGGTRVRESEQSFSSNVRTPRISHAPKLDEVGTTSDRANEQSRAHDDEDEELQASFPITCPIEGCRKRFTHVTALRFHLNHTRHDCLMSHANASCNGVHDRLPQKTDLTQNPESRPPSISPPCPVSPTLCSPSIMPPPRPQEMSISTPLQQTTISPSDRRPQLSVDEITGNGGSSRTVIKSQNAPGGHCFSTINGTERTETQFLPTLSDPFKSGNKCHSLSTYSNGNPSFHESTGPPGVAARTVTAHTVTVPHGPVTKSELGNSAKPGSYSSSSKRPSSTVQRDLNTSRARLQVTKTTTMSHGCKSDIPGNVSTLSHCPVQSNGKSSAQNKERLDHLTPFVPRVSSNPSNVRSRVESEANFTSHMINSLANIPRDSPLNHTSVANQLFPLPPGVWNFSSIPNYHSNSISTIEAQRASNLSLSGTGDPLRGNSGLPFSSYSSSNTTSSSVNLSSFLPQQSPANFTQQNYYPHAVSNSQGLPVRAEIGQPTGGDQVIDPSQLYGLPDFLVAAAMNALGSNFSASAAAAAAEALRSYSSSQNPTSASKFPTPPISLPLPPHLGPPQAAGAPFGAFPSSVMAGQSLKPPNLSNSSLPQLPSSLMSMMGGAAPPAMASSLLHNFGLTPSASAGSGPGSADRLDPLKFSAAYLMQQAASGSSTFGHPST